MIRFGMALMEMIEQLTKGFIKSTGRQPDNLEKLKIQQEAVQRFKDMNKVVDMEGKAIDTSKGIMGGKQIKDSPEFGKKIKETYDAAKGPGKGQEMVDALKSPGAKKSYKIIEDQLGVKLYGDETFEEILKIQKTGKHPRGEPKIKIRSMIDDAIDNVSPGFVKGDRKYNAQLVAEDLANKKFGKDFYDLDQKQQMDLYGEALDELTDLDKFAQGGRAGFKDGMLKKGLKAITGTDTYKTLEDRGFNAAVLMSEGFDQIYNLLSGMPGLAEGGRIGYKDGPEKPGRRTFMKAAAGLASLLPFGLGKVGKVAAPVVTKAAEITGPALAKLVETVMSLGKTLSMKGRKLKELTTKKKYKDIEVEEDMLDGPSYTIKKGNKEIYYKPGRMDETGGIEDDIIEIIDKPIKKAGGGIARMLGE